MQPRLTRLQIGVLGHLNATNRFIQPNLHHPQPNPSFTIRHPPFPSLPTLHLPLYNLIQLNMRSDAVTIQPEVVQFGRQPSQTIKVINHTPNTIPNFFFCLYNSEKFAFSPDSFTLAPHEHKLVTISLKIKSARAVAKEFAYLKSTDINKRLTLLINQFQSPQAKTRTDEGQEDLNTLSSREYRDIQTQAIEKIIKQKEAYIALLQREGPKPNFRTEESAEKAKMGRREVEELEMKLILTENQKQSILKENLALERKFEQYRQYCQTDLRNYQTLTQQFKEKIEDNLKMQQEINYLEEQGTQFLKKIEEKEVKIAELEQLNRRIVEDTKKDADKKFTYMEERLQEQKNIYQQSSRSAEERIRELQKQIESTLIYKEKSQQFEKELKRKEEQVRNLMEAIETDRSALKDLEVERKKYIRYEMLNESMNEKNSELTSRLKELQKNNQNLRQQVYSYKSKAADNQASTDKMNQYLQIALQSCRTENDALKRSKQQLEKSLDEFMSMNRQSHDNNKTLSQQIAKFKQEVSLLLEIKDQLQRRIEELKQDHHLAMMQLKTENIQLLEKLSMGEVSKREEKIKILQDELIMFKRQQSKYKRNLEELTIKNEELVIDNTKLSERVRRYKKEAKKELRNINDTAINQLHKEHEQKKEMARRIAELEQVILNYSCDKVRGEKEREILIRQTGLQNDGLRKDRTSSRVLGIRDQRKQIQYSQTSNNEVYSELGQLRQMNSYIKKEQERFNRLFQLQVQSDCDEVSQTKPIFRVIKFFQLLENRLGQPRIQDSLSTIKELEYLKGRIKQLQCIKEDKENISSINLSKTREQCGELLQYVRQEMKSQYKKLNEALKLSEQKFELLKKKIYEEYRSRLIDMLNKKQKNSLAQIEATLERFIDSMGNLSHKEAVLHKQIKLKQNARKQNVELKQKVTELNFMLQTKKGYCSRDPIKLVNNEAELEWQQSLKREAQLLTLTAEYQRLKQEFELIQEELSENKQHIKSLEKELDDKSSEVLKLKKYQIQIQTNYESEIQKQYQIIEQNKKRIMEMTKTTKETIKHYSKEKQYNTLKDSLDKQKDVIRQLRDKQRVLEELLQESHRSEEKEKKKINQQNRVIQSMRDLKDSNRELRNQNGKLKQRVAKLEDDIEKKNTYLKNLKEDIEQNRVRVQRKEEVESQRLREQVKRLSEQLRKIKEQLQKSKKKKDKDISELKNENDKLKNQNIITQKSLESIIRALMDTIRKIYGRLKRSIKKKRGRDIEDKQKVFESSQGVHINALKIDEVFQEILSAVEEID